MLRSRRQGLACAITSITILASLLGACDSYIDPIEDFCGRFAPLDEAKQLPIGRQISDWEPQGAPSPTRINGPGAESVPPYLDLRHFTGLAPLGSRYFEKNLKAATGQTYVACSVIRLIAPSQTAVPNININLSFPRSVGYGDSFTVWASDKSGRFRASSNSLLHQDPNDYIANTVAPLKAEFLVGKTRTRHTWNFPPHESQFPADCGYGAGVLTSDGDCWVAVRASFELKAVRYFYSNWVQGLEQNGDTYTAKRADTKAVFVTVKVTNNGAAPLNGVGIRLRTEPADVLRFKNEAWIALDDQAFQKKTAVEMTLMGGRELLPNTRQTFSFAMEPMDSEAFDRLCKAGRVTIKISTLTDILADGEAEFRVEPKAEECAH